MLLEYVPYALLPVLNRLPPFTLCEFKHEQKAKGCPAFSPQ
jgi:hypothetical protein